MGYPSLWGQASNICKKPDNTNASEGLQQSDAWVLGSGTRTGHAAAGAESAVRSSTSSQPPPGSPSGNEDVEMGRT